MTEQGLRGLIEAVRRGALTRRKFVGALAGLGIAAPLASQLLLHAGIAQAQAPSALIVQDHAVIPLITRPQITASNLKLRALHSGWDSDFWALQDWYREA